MSSDDNAGENCADPPASGVETDRHAPFREAIGWRIARELVFLYGIVAAGITQSCVLPVAHRAEPFPVWRWVLGCVGWALFWRIILFGQHFGDALRRIGIANRAARVLIMVVAPKPENRT